jgi:hypothetical protein
VAGRGINTIIITLFFFSGINAVFMGIIGEYVGRIYHQARYGRRVAVRRLLNFNDEVSRAAPSPRARPAAPPPAKPRAAARPRPN